MAAVAAVAHPPAATNHDINGNFNASGAVKLGAGLYTIDGYFTLGANGGGSATCDGETVSVRVSTFDDLSARRLPGQL